MVPLEQDHMMNILHMAPVIQSITIYAPDSGVYQIRMENLAHFRLKKLIPVHAVDGML